MSFVFSDSHEQPDKLSPRIIWLITHAKERMEQLIGNGDIFDFLPRGFDKWVDAPAIKEFIDLLDGQAFTYIAGNHDPYRWVVKLLAPYPNISVHKRYDHLSYHFRHGHGWSIDWRFLQYFASDFVEFMADRFPKQWYWLSRKMGWLPGKKKPGPYDGWKGYEDAIGIVWRNAIKYAQYENMTSIIGHTHCAAKLVMPFGIRELALVDSGSLRDGTYLRIQELDIYIEHVTG